jgi:hypothetical protein
LLFTYFKDTFRLPEVWPFFERGLFASGGLSLGNAVLEFVTFPREDSEPLKTEFRGIAFEPTATVQAQEPANPLLGCGLGVDHIGIAVRNLTKTREDYEQVLGFRFMEIPPQPGGFVPHFITAEVF